MDEYKLELNYDETAVADYILQQTAMYKPGKYKYSSIYGDVIFIPKHI